MQIEYLAKFCTTRGACSGEGSVKKYVLYLIGQVIARKIVPADDRDKVIKFLKVAQDS